MSNLIGQTLGPYRIIEQIGIGGMATVYKAYQPSMDRYVAIKVLPAVFSRDPAFLKRFKREAEVVAKLEHKHILPVHDYDEQEGLTYLVMRYVEAGTLKDRLAAGQLDLPAIYRIMAQVGAALDYAHRLGVIHRDVKPSNVLIDSQGDAYLTDFGLARIMESSEQLTATGVGVGTPAYMAPEQGQGLKIDHRSDVYSLGVMLYEMVTGQVPYQAETPMAVVIKHITEPLPLPRQIVPDLSEEVERVILKALAKNPDDRFPTVREMVEALDLAVRAATAAAPAAAQVGREVAPPVSAAPARKFGWPWDVRTTALGVVIAALALLVIGGMFFALGRIQYRVQVVGGRVEVVPVSTEAVAPTPAVALVETPTSEAMLAATATPTAKVILSVTTTPTTKATLTPTGAAQATLLPTPIRSVGTRLSPTPTPFDTPPTPTPTNPAVQFAYEVLDLIEDQPPAFEDSFDIGGNWIVNLTPQFIGGLLVVPSIPRSPDNEDNWQAAMLDAFKTQKLAASVDLRIADTNTLNSNCSFEVQQRAGDPDYGKRYLFTFSAANQAYLVRDVNQTFDTIASSRPSIADFSEFNNATIIVYGDRLAAFVNGELAYAVVDPTGPVVFSRQHLAANSGAVCEFDNFRTWNLDDFNLNQAAAEVTAPSMPTPTLSLSGRVTDAATGQGIAGAMVEAAPARLGGLDDWDYSAITASDGSYALFGLPTGDYVVRVIALGYAREYYDNVTPSSEAKIVHVTSPHETPGIDFDLTEGGSISGYAYQSDGITPIHGVEVDVRPSGDKHDDGFRASTASDGSYTIEGLALGEYRVRAEVQGWIVEYYDNVGDWDDATDVVVTPPKDTPNIKFSLSRGGSISGFVYENDGVTPVQGVEVLASGELTSGEWVGGDTRTQADGSYVITDLPAWDYRVHTCNKPGFAAEYYDSKYVRVAADMVTVREGSDTSGINFTLDAAGSITGHVYEEDGVTPISGVAVGAWLSTKEFVVWFGDTTEYDGSYSGWLGTGSYLIGTNAEDIGEKYVNEWYENHYDMNNADLIQVVAPYETSGIDFYLAKAGSISGYVYEEDGITPIAGAGVYAFPITGDHPGNGANTGPDGSYTIEGLPSGTYKVQATVSDHVPEYYDNAPEEASATEVIVNAPNDTPGIDFRLSPVSG
ncbi:MAG: hypothetical protein E3J21_15520 [Anaerolineales bacterium]|nr:MAG: hypothetical protein E3J21_15520 [Anaerolineales bacterium]